MRLIPICCELLVANGAKLYMNNNPLTKQKLLGNLILFI